MRRGHALLVLPVLAGVLALLWWTPWESHTVPVTTLARKAFGSQPVVHVLARSASARHPVAANDGIEIWYRGLRRGSHIVVRRGGKVVLDTLEKSIEPPSVPPISSVPSPLWSFVTSYRSDLAGGRPRVAREEPVEGRKVIWLEAENLAVAIDPTSFQPLWVGNSPPVFGGELIRLVTAETVPYNPVDFVLLRNRKPRHL